MEMGWGVSSVISGCFLTQLLLTLFENRPTANAMIDLL
jgi:hypothetical protein